MTDTLVKDKDFYRKQHGDYYSKYLGVPLVKSLGESEDGLPLVRGFFTSDAKDELGDTIIRDATERALTKYRQWGNIRYMHLPRPVGKITRIGLLDGLEWNEVEIKVIDPQAAFEVRHGLLSALSVGIVIKWDDIEIDDDGGWIINDYQLAEISLVDHPANYDAILTSVKGMFYQMAVLQGQDAAIKALDALKEDVASDFPADSDAVLIEQELDVIEDEPGECDCDESCECIECHTEELQESLSSDDDVEDFKSVVPYSDTGTADKETEWSKPSLGDFTDESWENLPDGEKRRIARHYTWSASIPPETFGDLKLPHHQASRDGVGSAVWRGVAAAMSRLNQAATDIPEDDKAGCYNHLAKHYRQFDEEPPEKSLEGDDMGEEIVEQEELALDSELIVEELVLVEEEPEIDELVVSDETADDSEPVEEQLSQEPDLLSSLLEAVRQLRQDFEDLRASLETVAEAQQEQTSGDDVPDEVDVLRQEVERLRLELEERLLPASRDGLLPEVELPEVTTDDEKSTEVAPAGLRAALGKYFEHKKR